MKHQNYNRHNTAMVRKAVGVKGINLERKVKFLHISSNFCERVY